MRTAAAPGLYLHVPFCRSKCRYCGFYSVVDEGSQQRWLEALSVEAASVAEQWSEFDTVYLGGGTPSVLDDARLERMAETLRQTYAISPTAEWTVEVNPADVTLGRARSWRCMGFCRVSVGVQSFRADELRWLGRRHDPRRARLALDDLRSAGFENLGVDLVQGLPGQSLDQRLDSLDQALALTPEHLSCYELTIEPGTPLGEAAKAGRCELPDADAAADAWLATSERAQAHGYVHYEVSNFARGPEHKSRHNVKYWSQVSTLGLGPAAHSFSGRARWSNSRSVLDYCQAIEAGRSPIATEERLTDEQLRWERVALGLRTSEGIAVEDLDTSRSGLEIQLAELARLGLLERVAQQLIPTQRGWLVADAMARQLLFGPGS